MKNAIRISVEKPCLKKFESFSPTATGGYCGTCQKEVIDFTEMSSAELVTYFNKNSANSCGRFKKSQLKTYEQPMSNTLSNSFVSRGLAVMSFSLLSLCAISNVRAQDQVKNDQPMQTEFSVLGEPYILGKVAIQKYTASGTVIDEENLPLGGVNVVLKGSREGVVTDMDGTFKFSRQLDVDDVLIFSYIGYEPQEYTIVANAAENLAINITFDLSNISLMGAVEVEGVYKSKQNIFQKVAGLFK